MSDFFLLSFFDFSSQFMHAKALSGNKFVNEAKSNASERLKGHLQCN